MEPEEFTTDFAMALIAADARSPQAVNARSGVAFRPGIGPHSEAETVRLVGAELEILRPLAYRGRIAYAVPYPEASKQKCDLRIGASPAWDWAIEVKMLRILGDNGKANDNILMHILSPYSEHRSALTDCDKLSRSALGRRKMILIYGYESAGWPLATAIDAFESLALRRVSMSTRRTTAFEGLMHPVHRSGKVFAWEIGPLSPTCK